MASWGRLHIDMNPVFKWYRMPKPSTQWAMDYRANASTGRRLSHDGQGEYVAGTGPVDRVARRLDFAAADGGCRVQKTQTQQFGADDPRYFAGSTTAQLSLVLLHDHEVRPELRSDRCERFDLRIAAIACMA